MLIDDFRHDRESETDTAGLRGEKRIEDVLDILLSDTAATVDDAYLRDVLKQSSFRRHCAIRRGRLRRVQQQVIEHALHEFAVDIEGWYFGRVVPMHCNG